MLITVIDYTNLLKVVNITYEEDTLHLITPFGLVYLCKQCSSTEIFENLIRYMKS
jgi:hypothetical protein